MSQDECGSLLFKNDRMYMHKLIRFNYTTYNVRRAKDVINPNTSHNNVMLLAKPGDLNARAKHPFLYARVLRIYHVNVIYLAPGVLDYRPRRMEFLWVRWYDHVADVPTGWDACRLDRLRFSPMSSEGAFSFVDPADILRSCHIIPRFAVGRQHPDGVGMSKCAKDSRDWRGYYVGRYV
jgi:hypothetical protein